MPLPFRPAWLTAFGFVALAHTQQSAPSTETSSPYTFSTNVDWVVLNATVRDRKGWFASDLSQADFKVYEDGQLQTVRLFRHEDVPVYVGLVVDHSASMSPKIAEVLVAAKTFVAASRADDDMFVVNFNDHVVLEGSNHPDQLARSISSVPTQGKTALYDAVIRALAQVKTGTLQKKALMVISDGGDNASRHTLAEVLKAVEESNVLVYTIGVFDEEDPDKNEVALRRLAHVSGGEAFFPRQLNQVVSICERIARDIRNQYILGYVSSNGANPGVYHSIRLAVHAEGKGRLESRTRAGYIEGETSK